MKQVTLNDKLKFAAIILIAGTSWLVIPPQIAYVGVEFSIAYRMLLGGLFVGLFAFYKKAPLPTLSKKNGLTLLTISLFLYSLNYLFIYSALEYLPSGIGSLVISAIIIPNALLGRLILKAPIKPQVALGATLSLVGLAILFPGNLFDFDLSLGTTLGFVLLISSLFLSAFGTIVNSKFTQSKDNLYWVTSLSMIGGGLLNLAYGYYQHQTFFWTWSPTFWILLLYVSLLTTAVVLIFYLQIVNKFGPGNASYVWIMAPVIALNLSNIFEGMAWTSERLIATLITLIGGGIALQKRFPKSFLKRKNHLAS